MSRVRPETPCSYGCGRKTTRESGACAKCLPTNAKPGELTDDDILISGNWRPRRNRRGHIVQTWVPYEPPPQPPQPVQQIKPRDAIRPWCPGLACALCLGDLSTGTSRPTDEGLRHSEATVCVEWLRLMHGYSEQIGQREVAA